MREQRGIDKEKESRYAKRNTHEKQTILRLCLLSSLCTCYFGACRRWFYYNLMSLTLFCSISPAHHTPLTFLFFSVSLGVSSYLFIALTIFFLSYFSLSHTDTRTLPNCKLCCKIIWNSVWILRILLCHRHRRHQHFAFFCRFEIEKQINIVYILKWVYIRTVYARDIIKSISTVADKNT